MAVYQPYRKTQSGKEAIELPITSINEAIYTLSISASTKTTVDGYDVPNLSVENLTTILEKWYQGSTVYVAWNNTLWVVETFLATGINVVLNGWYVSGSTKTPGCKVLYTSDGSAAPTVSIISNKITWDSATGTLTIN